MRKVYIITMVLVMLILTITVANAQGSWCCGSLGAKCATEKEQRDWLRIYGNEGASQWHNHNCGTPNTVYVAPTPAPAPLQFNLDLSSRDTLGKLNQGVTKITQSSAAQSYANASQKVIRQVNSIYQKTTGNSCGFWDKMKMRNGCKF